MYKIEKALILTKNGWLQIHMEDMMDPIFKDYDNIHNYFKELKEVAAGSNMSFEKYIFTTTEV